MGEKIALGFHACVDYELDWDLSVIEGMIREFDVRRSEIQSDIVIDSERALLIVCLAHMMEGTGGEIIPERPEICTDFADHFHYRITIGGTAMRAATAIRKIGYESVIQTNCFNKYIKELVMPGIHYFPSVGMDHTNAYPHVILSYQGNVRIQANDIDFVTPRENRVMFSRDIDSLNMLISQDFAPMIRDAKVFLLSCFSEVLDFGIMEKRMEETRELLRALPEDALVVMEDGCYIVKEHRYYVHEKLRETADILSMNEDELQEYMGRRINISDPNEVLEAVQYAYGKSGIPTLIVHSAMWALAYGERADMLESALRGGIALASARFCYGDVFGVSEYEKVRDLPERETSKEFSRQIIEKAPFPMCCIPTKDMGFVENPTVVGLGDYFAGGLLPELAKHKKRAKGNSKNV